MTLAARWIAIVCLASATPCLACYNDTAVERGEEQFRSQYNSPANSATPVDPTRSTNPWAVAAMCAGSALAAGSLIVAVDRQKKNRHEKAAD